MNNTTTMLQYVVYGKIIIDDIRLSNGEVVSGVLGGGGPQGAFGARLWSDSVGFLSRTGADFEEEFTRTLEALDIDLAGWARFPHLATLRNQLMAYDEQGYIVDTRGDPGQVIVRQENWDRLLSQPLSLPPAYERPRAIHLITEYPHEPMLRTALELRSRGSLLSLEPLIDFREWKNRESMLELMKVVDVVSPDWPSASGFAGTDDPREVVQYWSRLGPRMVAIRHGHHGSYAWDIYHDINWHIPPVPVDVVDPTGAGNSYAGGQCVGWCESGDARLAACYGAVSASFMVERIGLPAMSEELRQKARARLERALNSARRL